LKKLKCGGILVKLYKLYKYINNMNKDTDKKLHASDVMFSFWFVIPLIIFLILSLIFGINEKYEGYIRLFLTIISFCYVISINKKEKEMKN
jgi:hypothetical protein